MTITDGTIICTPDVPDCCSTEWRLRVSPMDLYVVERMGKIVDRWLLTTPAERYGQLLGPIPGQVAEVFADWPEIVAAGPAVPPKVRLARPLSSIKIEALVESLKSHASPELRSTFKSAIQDVQALATCSSCGKHADFTPWGPTEFHAECEQCRTNWDVRINNGRRKLIRRTEGESNSKDTISWAGRDVDEFILGQHPSS